VVRVLVAGCLLEQGGILGSLLGLESWSESELSSGDPEGGCEDLGKGLLISSKSFKFSFQVKNSSSSSFSSFQPLLALLNESLLFSSLSITERLP